MTDLQNHIELDLYVWSSKIVILQRWPSEESRLKSPIRPFPPMVCISILFTIDSCNWTLTDFNMKVWICFVCTTLSFVGFLALYEVILRHINRGNKVTPEIETDCNTDGETDQTAKNKILISLIVSYLKHFSLVLLQGIHTFDVSMTICSYFLYLFDRNW